MTTTSHPLALALSPGVHPVHRQLWELERIATEVALYRAELPELEGGPPKWGREAIGRRKIKTEGGYVRLVWTINSRGWLVQQWYLRPGDLTCSAYSGPGRSCPIEAAWLETLKPGSESEPAWLYLSGASVDDHPARDILRPSITVSLKARESILDRISHHDHRRPPGAAAGHRR
ncbi:hypothetical protein FB106_12024 [Synechococcus sp. Ace-Pa]|uniref:hypothetical protein n=1 Tax=Synechococcaceae TaxID=1890426 RepID=UPI0011A22899|nr:MULTISPECIES: hypothetical protein [Synechococcaceae]MCT4364783.1 hypothetical protein [Candidatus Regnicoccus frigidus MAG-AL1]MCT4366451.1 hypothetical protein [Candidatus Regnicoccus frigidus MAG-AL2]TWB87689.1 hypothetical protein FB106_12024 [Synechococcus sp. Ace-Pa]